MPQPRYTSLWCCLCVSLCLIVLTMALFVLPKAAPNPQQSTQLSELSHTYKVVPEPPVVTNLRVQPAKAPPGPREEEVVADPVRAADKIATQIIEASSLEEFVAGPSGPRLTAAIGDGPISRTNEDRTALLETQTPTQAPVTFSAPVPLAPLPPAKSQPMPRQISTDWWCEPEVLIESLNKLAGNGPAGHWATAVVQQIQALGPAIVAGSGEAAAIVDRLDRMNRQAASLAERSSDRVFARQWQVVVYALGRRVDIWRQVVRLRRLGPSDSVSPELNAKELIARLAKVDAMLGGAAGGDAWREFLCIDELKKCAARHPSPEDRQSREVARQALTRLMQTPFTPDQQRLIWSAPVESLRDELWRWAAKPVVIAELLRDIERYERTRLQSDARRLAIDYHSLLVSPVEARRRLADRVDVNYRNANFRFAVTGVLLNSLIPEQKLEYARVNDMVVGRSVQGDSLMATEISVEMVPDPHRALLALVVKGEIAALTATDAGPVRFHNESESSYVARKMLEINMEAISLSPQVEVNVQNETRLDSVETPVDSIPLISWLADKLARSQHDMKLPAATEEMKQKIVDKVTDRINAETRKRFGEVVDRLNQRVIDPLNSLALDPQMIDAATTDARFTMRLRLGGEDQLGSHTPRPNAPADSLASVQIHESVLNNGIQRLQLDGRTFTLPELSRHVASRLSCPAAWPTNPDNDDVKIKFAERNSIVIRCQEGHVVLTLSIARLSKGLRKWRNFQVEAIYEPRVHGRSARLEREAEIHLIGPGNIGTQIALRGIFSHALSKKASWELVPEKIVNQPNLRDAAITQFDIVDGWIGLSLGRNRWAQSGAARNRR